MKYSRVWTIDTLEGELCLCIKCGLYLTPNQFHKNLRQPNGLSSRCKVCTKLQRQERQGIFDLSGTTNQILENIGYIPNSDISVHQQFMLKHKIKTKQNKR